MSRRYNYFDDEPEFHEKKKGILSRINLKKIADNAKTSFEELAHGETLKDIKELREMPNLRIVLLKLTAFVLFIAAILIFIFAFSHTINSQNKKNQQFYNDAGKVCTDYITDYGTVKWESLDSDIYGDDMAKMTGLCYARQMDFNNDGYDELMLCYNNKNIYTLEVWGYADKTFSKLYSEAANSTSDEAFGSWIGLYHKGNKYYICKSTADKPELVELYSLKGSKFTKSSECDYDYENDIYSVKGKINAEDFETIRLSVIKTAKAENLVDTVTANIDSFSTVSLTALEAQKTDKQLMADAYYEIIEKRIEQYGQAQIVEKDAESYIDGVAVAQLIDFDNDETDELFLVYRKQLKKSATNAYNGEYIIIEDPTYCMEVYSWNGAIAQKLLSKDNISNYISDTDINYVMLESTNSGTDICINNYNYETSYTYTASSKIYQLKDNEFSIIFNARLVDDYGYRSYYIDNEYVYSSSFKTDGYRVPKFMDDDGSFDEDRYTLTYVSGSKSDSYKSTIEQTVKTIQSLNKNYSPD